MLLHICDREVTDIGSHTAGALKPGGCACVTAAHAASSGHITGHRSRQASSVLNR